MINISRKEAQILIKAAEANGQINGFNKEKETSLYSLFDQVKSSFIVETSGIYEIQTVEIEEGAAVQRSRHLDRQYNPLQGRIGNWKFSTRS